MQAAGSMGTTAAAGSGSMFDFLNQASSMNQNSDTNNMSGLAKTDDQSNGTKDKKDSPRIVWGPGINLSNTSGVDNNDAKVKPGGIHRAETEPTLPKFMISAPVSTNSDAQQKQGGMDLFNMLN